MFWKAFAKPYPLDVVHQNTLCKWMKYLHGTAKHLEICDARFFPFGFWTVDHHELDGGSPHALARLQCARHQGRCKTLERLTPRGNLGRDLYGSNPNKIHRQRGRLLYRSGILTVFWVGFLRKFVRNFGCAERCEGRSTGAVSAGESYGTARVDLTFSRKVEKVRRPRRWDGVHKRM